MNYKQPELMTAAELREAIISPIYSDSAKQRMAALLVIREADNKRLNEQRGDYVKKIRADHQKRKYAKQQAKFRGSDQRAVKNSAKNGIGIGTVTTAGVWVREVWEVYSELQGSGLGEAISRARLSDFQLVMLFAVFSIAFMITLGYKVLKHWEGK